MQEVARQNWVFVTNNAFEFRGRYRKLELHPGVVFIVPSVPRAQQIELFEAALSDIQQEPDLLNVALDVRYEGSEIVVSRYSLP
jgi:hypothetical protein